MSWFGIDKHSVHIENDAAESHGLPSIGSSIQPNFFSKQRPLAGVSRTDRSNILILYSVISEHSALSLSLAVENVARIPVRPVTIGMA